MSREEFIQLDLFAHSLAPLLAECVQHVAVEHGDEQNDFRRVGSLDELDIIDATTPQGNRRNFRLTGTRGLAPGGKQRAKDNIAAIRLLQKIEAEGRPATTAEQAALIKFSAFSSSDIAQNAFRRRDAALKKGWESIVTDLEQMVSVEEKAGLMRATQYAHFTPEFLIRAMWTAVCQFGFSGGRVLEPGCGTGLFFAAAPEEICDDTSFCGVEADPITARIAAVLHPDGDIRQGDFTQIKLDEEFDFAIGNPPFSDRSIRFTDVHPAVPLSLHDYFIARSIYRLRPGGIAAFVVSRWTMDKHDTTARELISDVADLVGAVRLPERALRKDAGTDVVVDVLFFRRRLEGEVRNDTAWIDVEEVVADDGEAPALFVNEYFFRHAEMVLGRHERASSAHGPTYTCVGDVGSVLEERLAAAISTLPGGFYEPVVEGLAGGEAQPAPVYRQNNAQGATIREGSYLMYDGALHQVVNGVPERIAIKGEGGRTEGITRKAAGIITALLPIRDAVRAVLRAQEADRPWQDDLAVLREAYDRFIGRFGPINAAKLIAVHNQETGRDTEYVRRPNLSPFMDDPDVWLVASIEEYDEDTGCARVGAIFTRRVVNAPAARAIVTAADALSVCLHDLGRVDIAYMAECLGVSAAEIEADLAGAIFLNPECDQWETADHYLSGPVRTKLSAAIAAAELDPRFRGNVEALTKAQPVDLKPSEIAARLGSPWLPTTDIEAFVQEVLAVETKIHHLAALGTWSVEHYGFAHDAGSVTEWGTARRNAGQLLEDALNANIPQIYDTVRDDGREVRILNASETEAAKEKLTKLKTAYVNWIWTDAERADRLCAFYNQTMNNLVPRAFDGSHLTLPGASNIIQFYPHQKRGIWRAVCDGSMYLAHTVGAGKTFTMAAAIMEQKRLGLISKAMMVVPSHCLAQASREFLLLYPNAKVLVADETNFVKAKRARFVARAATGDWDCIIITHSAFKFISVPAEFERHFLQDALIDFENMLDDIETGDRLSRKQLERQKEKFRASLDALKSRKDDLLTLSEIGINHIVVDEAQEFRKLSFTTNQTTLLGVDPDGSQRAWDLFIKSKFIETINPGRSLTMASGTPITNTIGELYTLQRFFVPHLLEKMGLQAFDAWALNFGEVRTELELQPSGTYKAVTRFSEFVNVPELIDLFRSFADIVQKDDIRPYVNIPRVAGGRRQIITADPSLLFKGYQRALDRRIKAIKARSGQPTKGADIILSVINDGRHAAIDLRLIDPTLPNDPSSKLNVMIDKVFQIFRETSQHVYFSAPGVPYERKGSSQLIFSDIGTQQVEGKRGFSAYSWIRTRLIELGVPPEEIAIIHDYPKTSDKLRLFGELKSGVKRICIGSTKKMGTGMNAQLRLAAIHHLDVPWIPSDVEQRDGRGERQGNQNAEIQIYCYATLTSMDATMWGVITRKQGFISAAMSGDRSVRRLEDAGSQQNQFALAKAIASGDQRLMQKAGLETEIGRLFRLKDAHLDSQMSVRRNISDAKNQIQYYSERITAITADLADRLETAGDMFHLTLNGVVYTERKKAGEALVKAFLEANWRPGQANEGTIGGFQFRLKSSFSLSQKLESAEIILFRNGGYRTEIMLPTDAKSLGLVSRLEGALSRFPEELVDARARVQSQQLRLADYQPRFGTKFDLQGELDAKLEALAALEQDLANTREGKEGDYDDLDDVANIFAGGHVPYVARPAPASVNDDELHEVNAAA